MEQSLLQTTVLLPILTSIITGGFVLVLVEIGNRKNRENDRYDMVMMPFMHKLSAYFRFLYWCQTCIKYPQRLNEKEENFKRTVEQLSKQGSALLISGGDYEVDHFSAAELYNICNKINHVWYCFDKMNSSNLEWDSSHNTSEEFISKELKEFFPNLLSLPLNVNLVSFASGDFYTDIYQLVEFKTYKHESYVKLFNWQSRFVAGAILFVLCLLVSLLFVNLPIWLIGVVGVVVSILFAICLAMLGVDLNSQIEYKVALQKRFVEKQKSMRQKVEYLKSVLKTLLSRENFL